MCQKTVPEVTNQGTDKVDQNDPPGNDVIQNSNLEMGFINRAVTMEMDNEAGYTKLERATDGYEKLQKLQGPSDGYEEPLNPVRDSQDYMVPQDQPDIDLYEDISDSGRE